MDWRNRIACDPGVHLGLPCIRGTDVLVWQIVEEVTVGETPRSIVRKHPSLRVADVRAAVSFAKHWAEENISEPNRSGPVL